MSQIHPAGSVRSTACHLAKRKPQRKTTGKTGDKIGNLDGSVSALIP